MSIAPEPYEYDLDNPLIYRNEMGRYKTARQLDFIHRHLSGPAMRILDMGGGGGRVALPLAQSGHEVTVVDISQEALDLVQSRSGGSVSVSCSDLMSFTSDGQFDVALVIDTLKYLTEVSVTEAFAKVNSLLPAGGVLIIAEINKGSWRNWLSVRLGRRREYPYNIETCAGYRAAIAGAGFEILREQGFVWMPLPFNSDSRAVRWFARLESALQLGRWARQSPWLLIAASKVKAPRAP